MQLTALRCCNVKISTLKPKTNHHSLELSVRFCIYFTPRTHAHCAQLFIPVHHDVIRMPHLHLTWPRSSTLESWASEPVRQVRRPPDQYFPRKIKIKNGTVSAKIAPRLKCYKNASRLNRYNFPTDNAIDFLFSTRHSEMV